MKGFIGGIVTGVIIFLGIIGVAICTTKIPAGYAGIVYNMNGGVEDDVLTQGWKVVSPTKKITKYTVALEQSYMTRDSQGDSTEDESFEIPTKEGAALEVDAAFSYSYDIERLPETFNRFRGQDGKEILSSFIKPKMQAWIKEITPEFTMMQIVATQRGTVNNTLTERLAKRFDAYGIVIDNIALADVRPDADTDKAIREKIQAQEALEKAKVTAETEKVNANKDLEVAKVKAEQDKVEAQGKADAKIIAAEAEAKSNKLISDSLTDKLIERQKVSKWKGDVPKVQGSGTPIIDIGDLN